MSVEEELDCKEDLKNCESTTAKLVILYLSVKEYASIDQMSEEFDLKKISLIPVVEELQTKGVLTRNGSMYELTS